MSVLRKGSLSVSGSNFANKTSSYELYFLHLKMETRSKTLPLVRQISIKLTTFSCLRSWRILISRKAVIGNYVGEKQRVGLKVSKCVTDQGTGHGVCTKQYGLRESKIIDSEISYLRYLICKMGVKYYARLKALETINGYKDT